MAKRNPDAAPGVGSNDRELLVTMAVDLHAECIHDWSPVGEALPDSATHVQMSLWRHAEQLARGLAPVIGEKTGPLAVEIRVRANAVVDLVRRSGVRPWTWA
jgi:hypothetical protein